PPLAQHLRQRPTRDVLADEVERVVGVADLEDARAPRVVDEPRGHLGLALDQTGAEVALGDGDDLDDEAHPAALGPIHLPERALPQRLDEDVRPDALIHLDEYSV